MNRASLILTSLSLALVGACSSPENENESAQDFAARIGQSGQPSAQGTSPAPAGAPVPAATYTPLPGAAPGQFVAGTATDPEAAGCGAPKVARFYGQPADETTRAAILNAVAPHKRVRFVEPGTTVVPNPDSTRLNIMVDLTGVIRDARCG